MSILMLVGSKGFHVRNSLKLQANSTLKRDRGGEFPEIEEALFRWIRQANAMKLAINGNILKEKAILLALKMGQDNFEASNGWLEKFKARRNIAFKRLHGEAGSVDANSVATWKGFVMDEAMEEVVEEEMNRCFEALKKHQAIDVNYIDFLEVDKDVQVAGEQSIEEIVKEVMGKEEDEEDCGTANAIKRMSWSTRADIALASKHSSIVPNFFVQTIFAIAVHCRGVELDSYLFTELSYYNCVSSASNSLSAELMVQALPGTGLPMLWTPSQRWRFASRRSPIPLFWHNQSIQLALGRADGPGPARNWSADAMDSVSKSQGRGKPQYLRKQINSDRVSKQTRLLPHFPTDWPIVRPASNSLSAELMVQALPGTGLPMLWTPSQRVRGGESLNI
ncbi:hypothetical protein LAZ67_3000445 [Cordylochernes scorpioides]|uniref:HTH CENPB-type domain-containing protein n=1 Tax=Cordylochernes scorpioides TaxID=51811 RepID=A0ABY6K722_9ARAC|nr:hypothetical protein LAZ67_3000445 [Cordylochernes scorpioides]